MTLRRYAEKRDFRKTPEPSGRKRSDRRKPIFVIQKHDASALHYDFRLQLGDVLKSWAVPKGPSIDPRRKRLAVEVEDHPLDYAKFEGVIPEGSYGAGTVIVWDTGTYENITKKEGKLQPATDAIASGHLLVRLNGRKLRGGFALQRFRDGDKPQWLLTKMRDEHADARRNPISTQPGSVLTGRTLEDVEAEEAGS